MDTWNGLADLRGERGKGDSKRLTKKHICIAHEHRQHCDESQSWGWVEGAEGDSGGQL